MDQFRVHALAVLTVLRRARQQLDDVILRPALLSVGGEHNRSERVMCRVQKLGRRSDLREGLDRLLP